MNQRFCELIWYNYWDSFIQEDLKWDSASVFEGQSLGSAAVGNSYYAAILVKAYSSQEAECNHVTIFEYVRTNTKTTNNNAMITLQYRNH
jgi:hypothetical protein